jgi:hypothetical protein
MNSNITNYTGILEEKISTRHLLWAILHTLRSRTHKIKIMLEKLLKAIIKAEESKATYNQIRGIMGSKKERTLLHPDNSDRCIKLTTKQEMEQALTQQNQKHTRQSLQIPFLASY